MDEEVIDATDSPSSRDPGAVRPSRPEREPCHYAFRPDLELAVVVAPRPDDELPPAHQGKRLSVAKKDGELPWVPRQRCRGSGGGQRAHINDRSAGGGGLIGQPALVGRERTAVINVLFGEAGDLSGWPCCPPSAAAYRRPSGGEPSGVSWLAPTSPARALVR